MGTTLRGLPYPELDDTPDVPRDIKALAEAVDTRLDFAPLVAFNGGVNTNGFGEFAVPTGYPVITAVGNGAMVDYPMVLLLREATNIQVVFKVINPTTGDPYASTTVGVSYVIFGPANF